MNELNMKRVIAVIAIALIQLMMILLKVIRVIDCDWGWVFAPLWIPYLLFILGISIIIIYVFATNVIERIKNGRMAQREKPGR